MEATADAAGYRALRCTLRGAVSDHAARGAAHGVPFAVAQSAAIGALLGELAITIASGPARCHRAHAKVITEELGRLVAIAAVAQAAAFPESEA